MPQPNRTLISSSFLCGESFPFEECKDHHAVMVTYAWASLSILCFAVGFPASVSILWEFFRTRRTRTTLTPVDFFILNLSTMDVVFLLFIPPGIINQFAWRSVTFEIVWSGVYALNMCGRPLLMACICVDCYMAVIHPIIYHQRKSLVPRVVMVSLVWTLTLAYGVVYSCSYKIFFTVYPAIIYMIAIVIIVICDSFILWSLLQSGPGRKNVHPQKQRAIHTLVYSLVMTVISYLPPVIYYNIVNNLGGNPFVLFCSVGVVIGNTSCFGSVVMPLLFLYNSGRLDFLKLKCSKL